MGLSVAVGMALGLRFKENARGRVFCILGDGETNEGNVWEAAMSAAHYHLDNLIAIVDYNKVMAKGFVWDEMAIEPFADKWRAFGWEVIEVDGHDLAALADAFHRARWVLPHGQPIVVIAHTVKGRGVEMAEFNYKWHTHAPDPADRRCNAARAGAQRTGARSRATAGWANPRSRRTSMAANSAAGSAVEMRDAFGQALVELGRQYPRMIVLDADLHTSSKAAMFKKAYPDRFIQVGIAEQNLFGIAAGLALSGFIPFPSTFAVFATRRALDQIAISICYPEPQRQDPRLVRRACPPAGPAPRTTASRTSP